MTGVKYDKKISQIVISHELAEGLKFLSEEELFNIPDFQAIAVETPNLDLVPTAIHCMERGQAMHMDKPGGEKIELFGQLCTGNQWCNKKHLNI